MTKRKILALTMALSMVAILAVGATLAYFTDNDSAENVFTVGSVDIELIESTLHRQNDNATDQQILADSVNYPAYLAKEGANMVPGRWVRKAPYVYNTGKNDAYVRVIVEQSDAMWQSTKMMEYTTAQDKGEIIKTPAVQQDDGSWVIVYTYKNPLKAGTLSYYAPIWQFQILENYDSDKVNWNDEEIVTVRVEAIQAEGFDSVEEAFAAFDKQN